MLGLSRSNNFHILDDLFWFEESVVDGIKNKEERYS